MVPKGETYEESRKKRLEENKKRMEELNLNKLAQALRPTSSLNFSPVGSFHTQYSLYYIYIYNFIYVCDDYLLFWSERMKKAKSRVPRQPVDPSLVRRSSRVADKPPPSYKEVSSLSQLLF